MTGRRALGETAAKSSTAIRITSASAPSSGRRRSPRRLQAGSSSCARARDTLRVPWFAIGGIDAETVADVAGSGAPGVAVVRAVRDADGPEAAARALRSVLPGPMPSSCAVRGGPAAADRMALRNRRPGRARCHRIRTQRTRTSSTCSTATMEFRLGDGTVRVPAGRASRRRRCSCTASAIPARSRRPSSTFTPRRMGARPRARAASEDTTVRRRSGVAGAASDRQRARRRRPPREAAPSRARQGAHPISTCSSTSSTASTTERAGTSTCDMPIASTSSRASSSSASTARDARRRGDVGRRPAGRAARVHERRPSAVSQRPRPELRFCRLPPKGGRRRDHGGGGSTTCTSSRNRFFSGTGGVSSRRSGRLEDCFRRSRASLEPAVLRGGAGLAADRRLPPFYAPLWVNHPPPAPSWKTTVFSPVSSTTSK